jgi:hypothetical protein
MTRPRLLGACVVLGLALAVSPVRASDFTGVYAIVEKVELVLLKPQADQRLVQIWGVFALAEGPRGSAYKPAERGYLYYRCPEARSPSAGTSGRT